MTQALGPVMVDIEGQTLTDEDREILQHPAVGGLIYFTRNFESVEQLTELTREINSLRDEPLLISVDHEGGRVQRFREGYTHLPACRPLGETWDRNAHKALADARLFGWMMAMELLVTGIDFSFAPVLDLDYGVSSVIGDRAFHSDPQIVVELAGAYMQGMHDAGMATVGKHFPGHGAVVADSHVDLPVDTRDIDTIMQTDMQPFTELNQQGLLNAVMPAHVIYAQADSQPAGFSTFWIQQVMRKQLGFKGVVFSDDLNMAAAGMAGQFPDRVRAALKAGVDMALVCNNRPGAIEVLDNWAELSGHVQPDTLARLQTMRGKTDQTGLEALRSDSHWQKAKSRVDEYRRGT